MGNKNVYIRSSNGSRNSIMIITKTRAEIPRRKSDERSFFSLPYFENQRDNPCKFGLFLRLLMRFSHLVKDIRTIAKSRSQEVFFPFFTFSASIQKKLEHSLVYGMCKYLLGIWFSNDSPCDYRWHNLFLPPNF